MMGVATHRSTRVERGAFSASRAVLLTPQENSTMVAPESGGLDSTPTARDQFFEMPGCQTVSRFGRSSAALAAASLRINGPIRYAYSSIRVSAPHSVSSVTSLWVVDTARPVRLLISWSPIVGRSRENALRMVIARAVTVRGVLSCRLPDTIRSFSGWVCAVPVRSQYLEEALAPAPAGWFLRTAARALRRHGRDGARPATASPPRPPSRSPAHPRSCTARAGYRRPPR
jgi:hypothetical protein